MFPLKDNVPADRTPFVNWLLLVISLVVFGTVFGLEGEEQQLFVTRWGLVPSRVLFGFTHGDLFLDSPWQWLRETLFPFVSSMFIHGGIAHLAGNLWFLLVFGDNVEGRLGHGRYLAFYVGCGVVAALLHVWMIPAEAVVGMQGSTAEVAANPVLDVPMVGASGAIAGVLGAYLVAYPRARVLTFLPPIFLFEVPALLFLGLWFVIQFFSARSQSMVEGIGVGVAYWAHVGGFLAGALAAALLGLRRREVAA
jgi:membrane associated rhomboid family serine protease